MIYSNQRKRGSEWYGQRCPRALGIGSGICIPILRSILRSEEHLFLSEEYLLEGLSVNAFLKRVGRSKMSLILMNMLTKIWTILPIFSGASKVTFMAPQFCMSLFHSWFSYSAIKQAQDQHLSCLVPWFVHFKSLWTSTEKMSLGVVLGIGKEEAVLGSAAGNHDATSWDAYDVESSEEGRAPNHTVKIVYSLLWM